ncbi:MAG: prepilin-type N-terminal cleavage/methylation domain-containing protein [Pedobacter sp.]
MKPSRSFLSFLSTHPANPKHYPLSTKKVDSCPLSLQIGTRQGFTLLEVMISLAIMVTVILTVLGSVNYHLGVIANERDNTTLTLLARARMAELEQGPLQQKSEGSFAPIHPELKWQAELFPTELPALQKLVVRVRRDTDKQEVALVRFVLK